MLRIKPVLFLILLVFNVQVAAFNAKDYAAELSEAQILLTQNKYQQAYQAYLQSAELNNNPLAQFSLALFYRFGWDRKPDPQQACHWYEKAAQQNIPAAQHFYAECLLYGISDPPDPGMAASWFKRAGDNGHTISFCSLGELYIKGIGVIQDRQQGLAMCIQAANAGIPKAMIKLADIHLMDFPELRSEPKAMNYLEQAALLKNTEAQFRLGMIYRDGINGHYIDKAKAIKWFEYAASLGYVPAYFQTGLLYFASEKNPVNNLLPPKALAKSYLWLSATKERTQDQEELRKSKQILKIIDAMMPATWYSDLNNKLAQHLTLYPVNDN